MLGCEQRRRYQGLRRSPWQSMQPCQRRSFRRPGDQLEFEQLEQHVLDGDDRIADNFQTFLTLLTTQLQNQNPLDPLDTNQFTQQLVQFAGVEQQLKSNDQLKSLIESKRARRRRRRWSMSATPSPSTAARRSSTNRRPGIFKSEKTPARRSRSPIRPDRPPIPAIYALNTGQLQLRLGRQGQ